MEDGWFFTFALCRHGELALLMGNAPKLKMSAGDCTGLGSEVFPSCPCYSLLATVIASSTNASKHEALMQNRRTEFTVIPACLLHIDEAFAVFC